MMIVFPLPVRPAQALSVLLCAPSCLLAGTPLAEVLESESSPSGFDSLLNLAVLYENPENPFIEKFKLRGRYQGQYHRTDADQGFDDGWEDRRIWYGFDALFLDKKIYLRVDVQSNDGFRDVYDGLLDTYIRWSPVENFRLTVGKQKPFIGRYDWYEPTTTQAIFERSHIFNQLNVNRATGVTATGEFGNFNWQGGVYSNDTPTNTGGSGSIDDGAFGDFQGGTSYSLGAGYDFKETLGADKAELRIDWLHSDRQDDSLVQGRYDDIFSETFWYQKGAASLVVEAYQAAGGDAGTGDLFGFFIQPAYDVVPGKLQLLARYSYSRSSADNGLRPQGRYERPAGAARGDRYQALYVGGQYFIHGENFKLMAGLEYASLGQAENSDSFDGYTFTTGIRMYF